MLREPILLLLLNLLFSTSLAIQCDATANYVFSQSVDVKAVTLITSSAPAVFFYQAKTGVSFTVYLETVSGNPDLYIGFYQSNINYESADPSIYEYSFVQKEKPVERIQLDPSEDYCYVVAVYSTSEAESSFTFSVESSDSLPQVESSACKTLLGDSTRIVTDSSTIYGEYVPNGNVYSYYYFSLPGLYDVNFKLSSAFEGLGITTGSDFDLYISDASNNLFPTASTNLKSSAQRSTDSEIIRTNSVTTDVCFAIGIRNSGSETELPVLKITVSRYYVLGAWFYVVVTVVPFVICMSCCAGICVYVRRRRRARVLANKIENPLFDIGAGAGKKQNHVVEESAPIETGEVEPEFGGAGAVASVPGIDGDVPPPAYNEDD